MSEHTIKVAILCFTDQGLSIAKTLQKEFYRSKLFTTRTVEVNKDIKQINSVAELIEDSFHNYDAWVFVGALGICVRSIAPHIKDKASDPAVINVDDQGKFVQAVLSGHIGKANTLTAQISRILNAQAVLSTSSDLQNLWALDTLAETYGWKMKSSIPINKIISLFVNRKSTALILKVKNKGVQYLEKTCPDFVDVYYDQKDFEHSDYELILYVGYEIMATETPVLSFYPPCVALGSGCAKDIEPQLLMKGLESALQEQHIAIESIYAIGSATIKNEEQAYLDFAAYHNIPFITYTSEELNTITVANPSEVVKKKVGVYGVSEAAAALIAGQSTWLVEKTKALTSSGKKFTYALSLSVRYERKASIAIVGAGSGDPELLTLKGQYILENADCILYAGSLVPEALTHMAKEGALVRNSASMTLEEQIMIIDQYYEQGKSIVRLHSGDPSIYGAIQEQMTIFDEKGYDYYIVPGISSFQAAAAYLKSEFTIPEVAQTIILTRGEGNTPMPEHEKIADMAKLRATMCIFLSVGIAKKIQAQLLEHYPENTPLAVLYRVSWEDEEVWTGTLSELTTIIKKNKLTRTVLIVVGEAVGARKNRSWLYDDKWHHIFRKKEKEIQSS
ncbi:precorrin-4 C11-methyltransferase [Aquimarina sp. EL_43]|uniref:precorrin-4 C(11)-methyltransferase n=1 Tax=unclassified Aquimarina TaxID=2627091 RepID=UPI0018CB8B69|nr:MULTISPECIES: precorrin-4 C(11)-methyltransferase [unclassified Aquimarina]MBG6130276.1 precorrin-4 C11-methyltransferase [Aquimarina sp. EL_35]MBG6149056.1 precorrin-4 C11-methyltransferase [Aquimarina sp. EL_32]MBG6168570.1 precorrin-4 C11-methyltransferase [Aquimarina sp. EL_43]